MTVVPIDSLRLHPSAEKVPMAGAEDLAALRNSLDENGQQDPIDVTPDGVILDGRTRWTLLQELDASTIQTRVVDYPEDQQTGYIVDRALSRRHLSMAQKQALNALMASVVTETRTHPKTGEEMRIGMGQTQRAAALGVEPRTVQNWEREGSRKDYLDPPPDEPAPTHFIRGGGNPTPYPIHPVKPAAPSPAEGRRAETRAMVAAASRGRPSPPWFRHFVQWCHRVLPEDKELLAKMRQELDEAIAKLGDQE